ncbi:MAG: HAD family hydrolase [Nitrososphaerota archaeon]|jgi:phosphoglycolate phosphatase|nr:HAD family hydrolase [Nitrososphaerota archaeon]
MRFKAVIFDLDGTLLNTLEDIVDSVNHVLMGYGLEINQADYYKLRIGRGAQNLIRQASDGKIDEDKIDDAVKEFQRIYAKRFNLKTRKYVGIDDLLNWLDKKRIQYAVLSNKPHNLTTKIVKHYFPHRNFSAIIGQQTGIPLKPDPAQVTKIISQFQCKAEEVVFIGDSGVDMETAHNAGTFALGVLWGYREQKELLKYGAIALAHKPKDIEIFIETTI